MKIKTQIFIYLFILLSIFSYKQNNKRTEAEQIVKGWIGKGMHLFHLQYRSLSTHHPTTDDSPIKLGSSGATS